ncbi:MAG: MBL fold metallo-hydrolase [Anaerolineae bacterium]
MRLTVLGSGAVRPNPLGASSGYLLGVGQRRYLVDCGYGVLSRLLAIVAPASLDGVLISHFHPDHCIDLTGVAMALRYAPGPKRLEPLPVYAAPDTRRDLEQLGAVLDAPWDGVVAFVDIDSEDALLLEGDLTVRFAPTVHYQPCLAMRFEHGGRTLTYTADTGPCPAVTDLASGSDLLIAESTLPERDGDRREWGHLTATEAGEMARRAGAAKLVLTHYFVEHDPERLRSLAAAAFGGPVDLAREGEVHDV